MADVIPLKKGSAPRVTEEHIENRIEKEEYHVFAGRLTLCILTLQNGFIVTGESSCVSAANFDQALGEKYARKQAIDKIWLLEGYLLAEVLHQTLQRA